MDLKVLGPIKVNGKSPTSRKQRALLTELARQRNRPVPFTRLVGLLWPTAPTKSPNKNLGPLISRLRTQTGKEAIERAGDAYRLNCHPSECDADRLRTAAESLPLDPAEADLETVEHALEEWQGLPYEELSDDRDAQEDTAQLEVMHSRLLSARVEVLLRMGRIRDALVAAERLTGRYGMRDEVWALRAHALAAYGQVHEARRVAQTFRAILREHELTPMPAFLDLEAQLDEGGLRRKRSWAAPHAATRARSFPQMVAGRRDCGDKLHRLTGDAVQGIGRFVVLTGAPGTGKSHVLGALREMLAGAGVQVAHGTCEHARAALMPLWPVLRALSDDPAAPVADGERDDEHLGRHTSRAVELLLGAADDRPFALLVDDAQWADRATLDTLAALAERIPWHRSLVVVIAHRLPLAHEDGDTEALSRLPGVPGVRVVDLDREPLEAPEVADLVLQAEDEPLNARLAQQLVDSTGGNPRSILQTVRDLRRDGVDLSAAGVARVPEIAPPDVEAGRLIRRLDDQAQRILCLAGLLGPAPRLDHLRRVLGHHVSVVLDAIAPAERLRVIRVLDGRLHFEDEAYRRAARRSLPTNRLHQLRVAILTELADDSDDDEIVAVRAANLLAARRTDPAVLPVDAQLDLARRGAAIAGSAGRWSLAEEHAAAAVELAPGDAACRHELGRTACRALHLDLASTALEEAAELARAAGDLSTGAAALADHLRLALTQRGDLQKFDPAEIDGWLASTAGVAHHDGERAQLLGLRSEHAAVTGDVDRARRWAREACEAADRSGRADVRAAACFAAGLAAFILVDLPGSRRHFGASLDHALPDHPWMATAALGRLAIVELLAGNLGMTAEVADRARDLCQRQHNWSERIWAEAVAAHVAAARGDRATAIGGLTWAHSLVRHSRYRFADPFIGLLRLHLALPRDDDRGRDEALSWWPTRGPKTGRCVEGLIHAYARRRPNPALHELVPTGTLTLDRVRRVLLLAEIAGLTGDAELAGRVRGPLDVLRQEGLVRFPGFPMSLATIEKDLPAQRQ